MERYRQKRGASYWCLIVLAIVIIIVGLPLIPGGVWLIALGGSWYYVFAGAALVISGIALLRGMLWGAALYLLTWVATVIWSLWEVGLAPWALLPRLFGLTLIAICLLAVLPGMRRRARDLQGV